MRAVGLTGLNGDLLRCGCRSESICKYKFGRNCVTLSWAAWFEDEVHSCYTDVLIEPLAYSKASDRGSTSTMWLCSRVRTACVSARVCVSLCLSAPLQGFVGLSIRVKGLLWNRSVSRVYGDPPRDENANAYAYPRLCVRRKKQPLRPKMASLFALLLLPGRFIKMHEGPGCMHVCKTVCRGIGMPSPPSNLWLNRFHHVCIRRADQPRSSQPRCMLMPPFLASLDALQHPFHDLDQHLSLWVLSFSGLFEFSSPPFHPASASII